MLRAAGLQSALEERAEVAEFLVNLDEVGGHFGPEVADAGHRVRTKVVDPPVNIIKALADRLKALPDLFKALINLVEAFVDRLKALVDLSKAIIDLFKGLLEPLVNLLEPLVDLLEPLVDLAELHAIVQHPSQHRDQDRHDQGGSLLPTHAFILRLHRGIVE